MSSLPLTVNVTQPGAPPTAGTSAQPPASDLEFFALLTQAVAATDPSASAGLPQANTTKAATASGEPRLPQTTKEEQDALLLASALAPAPAVIEPVPQVTDVEVSGARVRSVDQVSTVLAELQAASDRSDTEPLASDMSSDFDSVLSPLKGAESAPPASLHRPNVAHESGLTRVVNSPVGSAQWAEDIGSRLTLMAEQGRQSASIRLSPEHLGPLEIRISVRDDQASVWFGAAHADTRAAIEHALPRLREMFESQGMSLADAGVFQEAPRGSPEMPAMHEGSTSDEEAPATVTSVTRSVHLLDEYA